ncbi:hypothetical protein BRC62_05520 [Halobacteriales archaeon QH_10_67_13]|nr:MAG: hypothetical protein BRC62_05520 [Halobacteriales archaeon QH_10_67_13]
MSRVVDLREDDTLLHSKTRDGPLVFGGRLLEDAPATHLGAESPRYLLWNKTAGLEIDRPDGSTVRRESEENYRAVAVVTDARLLVIFGQAEGDAVESLPYTDVVEASVESAGLLTDSLVLETLSGDRWRFPCRGTVEPVAAYVDRVTQTWARVSRLLEDAAEALDQADRRLETGDHEGAAARRDDAERHVETAADRTEQLGAGAEPLRERRAELRSRIDAAGQRIRVRRAASAHQRAQTVWADRRYEEAATAYDAAIAGYEAARAIDTRSEVDERQIARRLDGARTERELLRVGPLIDADTARRRVAAASDPERGATAAQTALDLYRDALGLATAETERPFLVDREAVRERAIAAADAAIDRALAAGLRWQATAEALADDGRTDQAARVHERADRRFDDARALAAEVRPERRSEIEARSADREADGEPLLVDPAPVAESESRVTVAGLGEAAGTAMVVPEEEPTEQGAGLEQFETPDEEFGVLSLGTSDAEADGPAPGAATSVDADRIAERLDELPGPAFAELVGEILEHRGWTATLLSGAHEHDAVVTRGDGERIVVFTHNDPEARPGPEAVRRQTESAEGFAGIDGVVYATSSRVTDGVDDLALSVIDRPQLAELLRATDLLEKLPEVPRDDRTS